MLRKSIFNVWLHLPDDSLHQDRKCASLEAPVQREKCILRCSIHKLQPSSTVDIKFSNAKRKNQVWWFYNSGLPILWWRHMCRMLDPLALCNMRARDRAVRLRQKRSSWKMLELETCQSDAVPRGKEPQGCKRGWELVTELKVRLGTSALAGDPVGPYPRVFWAPIPTDHPEPGVKNLQVHRYLWVFTNDGFPCWTSYYIQ